MEKNGEKNTFLSVSQQDIEMFTIKLERKNTIQGPSKHKSWAKRPQDMGKPNTKRGQTNHKTWEKQRKDTGKRVKRYGLFAQNIRPFTGKQGMKCRKSGYKAFRKLLFRDF